MTLVRPVNDEAKLRKLDVDVKWKDLRKEFRMGIMQLKARLGLANFPVGRGAAQSRSVKFGKVWPGCE